MEQLYDPTLFKIDLVAAEVTDRLSWYHGDTKLKPEHSPLDGIESNSRTRGQPNWGPWPSERPKPESLLWTSIRFQLINTMSSTPGPIIAMIMTTFQAYVLRHKGYHSVFK